MDGDYLRLFAEKYGLDMETASEFAPYVSFHHYETDTVVIDSISPDKDDPCYFIVKGQAFARVRTESGIKYLFILRHRRILLDREIPNCEYGAYGGTTLMKIKYDDLIELAGRDRTIMTWYFDMNREGTAALVERISSLILKSAKERLLDYLDKNEGNLNATKKRQIADILGIAPGSLSRLLGSNVK